MESLESGRDWPRAPHLRIDSGGHDVMQRLPLWIRYSGRSGGDGLTSAANGKDSSGPSTEITTRDGPRNAAASAGLNQQVVQRASRAPSTSANRPFPGNQLNGTLRPDDSVLRHPVSNPDGP